MQEEKFSKPKPPIRPKPSRLLSIQTGDIQVVSSALAKELHCAGSRSEERPLGGENPCNVPQHQTAETLEHQVQDNPVNNVIFPALQQAKPPEDMDTVLTLSHSRSVVSFDDECLDFSSSFDAKTYSSISRTMEKKVFLKHDSSNNGNKMEENISNSNESVTVNNSLARVCWKSEEFLSVDPVASIEDLGGDQGACKSVENLSLARIEPSPEVFLDDILRRRRSIRASEGPMAKAKDLSESPETDDPGLSCYIPSIDNDGSDDGEAEEGLPESDGVVATRQSAEYVNVTDGKQLTEQDMPFYANLQNMDEETRKSLSLEDKEQIRKMNLFFGEKKDTKTDLEVEVFNSIVSGNSLSTRVRTRASVQQRGRRRLSHLRSNVKDGPTSHASGQLLQDLTRVKKWAADRIPQLGHRGKNNHNNKSTEDLLCSSSSSSSGDWKQRFIRVMQKHFRRMEQKEEEEEESNVVVATFGVHLEMCPMSSNNKHVPAIVEFCITVIENLGLTSQGIYRIPGNNASVNALLSELNKDPDSITFENERWQDVNVIGSLLKLFFRKLPEPLIVSAIYEDVIQAARCQHREKMLLKLKLQLLRLPTTNLETLKYLANHLKRVADNLESNRVEGRFFASTAARSDLSISFFLFFFCFFPCDFKMDAHNLAIMFGPSLVRPLVSEESTSHMLHDMKHQTAVVESIIKYKDWMFSEWTEEAGIPPDEKDEAYDPGSSPNVELLPNAEALLAIKQNETEPESPEELGSLSFFKQGLYRLSNRGKGKRKNSRAEGPSKVISNSEREVELRKVSRDALNGLVSKWKSRNPGLVQPATPDLRRNFTQRYTAKELEISAPLKRDRSPQHPEVTDDAKAQENVISSIKRYPAYSFQNTTIRGSNRRQQRAKPSEGNEPLSEFGGRVAGSSSSGAPEEVEDRESPPTAPNPQGDRQHSTGSEGAEVFHPADGWIGRKESFVVRKPGGRGYFASANASSINLFSGHSCASKMPFERRDIAREVEGASPPSSSKANVMDRRREFLRPIEAGRDGDVPLAESCHRR